MAYCLSLSKILSYCNKLRYPHFAVIEDTLILMISKYSHFEIIQDILILKLSKILIFSTLISKLSKTHSFCINLKKKKKSFWKLSKIPSVWSYPIYSHLEVILDTLILKLSKIPSFSSYIRYPYFCICLRYHGLNHYLPIVNLVSA